MRIWSNDSNSILFIVTIKTALAIIHCHFDVRVLRPWRSQARAYIGSTDSLQRHIFTYIIILLYKHIINPYSRGVSRKIRYIYLYLYLPTKTILLL